jgi:protein-tyrosine phosphatase
LLTLDKNYVLTEFSYMMRPNNIEEMLFNIITSGYSPVLAHPERYFYFHRNFEEYKYLKELGFHLQVNLLSLTGYYGKEVAKAGKYILEKGLADLVGTDLHHQKHLASMQKAESQEIFRRYIREKAYNVFEMGG